MCLISRCYNEMLHMYNGIFKKVAFKKWGIVLEGVGVQNWIHS